LAVPTRPVVVRAAPTLPSASQVRLPPASTACCDRPQTESFHLRPDTWSLVAHRALPVVAGGLHHHPGHAQRPQPLGQHQQRAGHGRVGAHLLQPLALGVGAWHPHTADQLRLADIQRRDPGDELLGVVGLLQHPASLVPSMATSTAARRSRKGQAESDPRAQGNTEGPIARLPASDLAPASPTKEQRRQRATSPHFQLGTGLPQGDQRLTPRYLIRMTSLVRFRRPPRRYQLRLTELLASRRLPRACATAAETARTTMPAPGAMKEGTTRLTGAPAAANMADTNLRDHSKHHA